MPAWVVIRHPWGADEKLRGGKISELFVYDNFSRAPADEVDAGDICAVTGLPDVSIGETICSRTQPEPLPTITVRRQSNLMILTRVSAHAAAQLRHVDYPFFLG